MIMHSWAYRAFMLASLFSLALVGSAQGEPLRKGDRVVFLGDSITQDGTTETGFQTLLQDWTKRRQAELGVRMSNAGISGDKVTDLQRRLERDVLAQKPTVVVIYIGINDVWRGKEGTPKDQYQAGLKDLIGRCGKSGARVVLCTPSVIGERKNGSNKFDTQLDDYAAVCRAVAKEMRVPVCDLRQTFVKYLRLHNPKDESENVLTKDGVHLNPAGNRLVAEELARVFGIEPARLEPIAKAQGRPLQAQPLGPRWFFRDGDRLYWNGSSHTQGEGWHCSVIEFYLRTRFPEWKIASGRGGPTEPSASAFAPLIDKLQPTVIFGEFGYYGGDDNVDGIVRSAEKLAALCQEKKIRLVMMPSAFRATHIDRLPDEYRGLSKAQIADLNAKKKKAGTLKGLAQDIPVEVHENHWRMFGAAGCDKRVAAMQAWGDKMGIFVPRTYQDQRDWLFKVWEKDPKFPWGGGHPPHAGYVAVGYFLLERMEAPIVENRLVLDAGAEKPTVKQAAQCEVTDLQKTATGLRFQRLDKILPVVPVVRFNELPREPCPLLKYSPYFLTVTGLPRGSYDILVESVLLGRATHEELAKGVNLNEVYLRSEFKVAPKVPWQRLWLHCRENNIDKDQESPLPAEAAVGRKAWRWELRQTVAK